MKIADVLRNKGEGVVTIRPDDTVAHLLEVLNERGIGAVVVSEDGTDVAGIVSERDVVRHLHRAGAEMISGPVSAIMTSKVTTASKDDDLENVARTMTEHAHPAHARRGRRRAPLDRQHRRRRQAADRHPPGRT